ncbi:MULTISPECIES: 2-hydroxychromene-2-carboxylate isomerase [unclassified Streptomyces]|uniref:2-hydroxychromene-2-carboxylate isomerase n=1 Tax=unclassified Streptomyces TaxID=2593676 RepID=UPI002361497D|nr:DsbA family protein [Streptomyces sp. MMBL 11-1]
MAVKPPRWYFSLRSPYSWLAFRELTQNAPDVAEAIEWRPYWEPDEVSARLLAEAGIHQLPYVPMSKEKHLYILQDVKRLAAERGLSVAWPVDTEPCWDVSHLAYLVAQDAGRGVDFIGAVYRARWEQGLDISDRATIAAIGEELGLDPEALAHAADDPEIRRRGVDALRAVDRDGVFGVPFFIHRHDKFWGSDRLPGFIASVRARAAASRTPSPPEPGAESVRPGLLVPAGDAGHAGGCG